MVLLESTKIRPRSRSGKVGSQLSEQVAQQPGDRVQALEQDEAELQQDEPGLKGEDGLLRPSTLRLPARFAGVPAHRCHLSAGR
ncbi:hypothetical protein GCM10011609_27240 [Lentzea pudingi]|uniref:Uncharacterized protein n=1 Tax=Lentzea pudingi TaxID=1789439 RepID=A0ABQ2HUZ0_9PSEU|nr:hypothetical protein GCM10011609_27240 [Lentzea pudingi]